jgi:cytochrome b6-f complex iron-sulfur subunit
MGEVGTVARISRRTFLLGALACSGCALGEELVFVEEGIGFGDTIPLGPVADIQRALAEQGTYDQALGRSWIVAVPEEWREPLKAATEESLHPGIDAGIAALFRKCPHQGCRVPECDESGQFECPCCGSVFGPLGELRGGPAPRGMDRFETRIENGELWLVTGTIIEGLPIGTELGEAVEPGCV